MYFVVESPDVWTTPKEDALPEDEAENITETYYDDNDTSTEFDFATNLWPNLVASSGKYIGQTLVFASILNFH